MYALSLWVSLANSFLKDRLGARTLEEALCET